MADPRRSTLARDLERMRSEDSGLAAVGKIAAELKAMREELRQQMASSLQREFDALRQDIEHLHATAPAISAELGAEFERLSDAIQTLAERSDDKGVDMLRLELEQVKQGLDTLAREESVRHVDRRWDEFDRKWSDFEDRVAAQPLDQGGAGMAGLAGLAARLEEIGRAVEALPDSLSLDSLEEKVRQLALSVDHLAQRQVSATPEAMAQIEERLDEISRAIAASSRTAEPQFDAEPFERIEARMASLARQVEELADDRPAAEVLSRINTLSARVDDIAQRVEIPQSVMERLSSQMALISAKLETRPEAPDSDALMRGIDQRFDRLSEALAQRQGDALEQGQGLVRELERRLGQVADRLEHHEGTAVDAGLVEAMEKRLAALQSRLEETSGLQLDPASLRSLEGRLDDISHRLETQVAGAPGLDPEIARNLEEQVAVLSQQLAKPGKATADFDEIGPRLELDRAIDCRQPRSPAAGSPPRS